jgi:phosphohistidine phosphatase
VKVYLVRHGRAVHPSRDSAQPLSDAGREEVRTVAARLTELGASPRWIGHSPKARAVETAGILADALGSELTGAARPDLLPNADVDPVAVELEVRDEDGLLVGHMPFMGDLARRLLGPGAAEAGPESLMFPTAGVLCLEREGPGKWRRMWMVGP